MEPHDYQIYYVNIDLRHQYGIAVAESQTFLRAQHPQRRRARRNGCFRRLVHTLTLVSIHLYNGHLFAAATFFCPQGGHCGKVQLCLVQSVTGLCSCSSRSPLVPYFCFWVTRKSSFFHKKYYAGHPVFHRFREQGSPQFFIEHRLVSGHCNLKQKLENTYLVIRFTVDFPINIIKCLTNQLIP